MKALITGGTGFIGEGVAAALLDSGWKVVILSRQAHSNTPNRQYIKSLLEINRDEVFAAVINLAGASLAGRRWNESYKEEIVSSRVERTRELVDMMAGLDECPPVLASASAVGYYGHSSGDYLDENSSPNAGFSSRLCHEWEGEAMRAEDLGCRVCLLRFGVVLDQEGGALDDMSRSFQMGLATWLGKGDQWMSWVHRSDVIAAIEFLLGNAQVSGPFNITAPEPVTSRMFAQALNVQYKTLLSVGVPAIVLKLALGEMANELLLNGQRVLPVRLESAGFKFKFPDITGALKEIYGNE